MGRKKTEFTKEDFENMYKQYCNRFTNEDKITLNGKQASEFMKAYCNGDIWGFETLQKILKEDLQIKDKDNDYTIYDLLQDLIAVNRMLVWGCEDTNGLQKEYSLIEKLYDKLKTKLFKEYFTNNFDYFWLIY